MKRAKVQSLPYQYRVIMLRRGKTGDRSRETEDRRQETEDGRQKTGDGRQETEDRRRKSEVGSCDKNLAFFVINLVSFAVKSSQRLK